MSAGPGIGVLKLSFEVPGRPVPKARARQGRVGRTRHRHFYTPDRTRGYQQRVAWIGKQARTHWENTQARTWPRTAVYTLSAALHLVSGVRGLPGDSDNLLKTWMDALQGILWDNDRSVLPGKFDVLPVARPELERAELTITIGGQP